MTGRFPPGANLKSTHYGWILYFGCQSALVISTDLRIYKSHKARYTGYNCMPLRACKICKNQFYTRPSFLKVGWGRYCSMKCKGVDQKNGKTMRCSTCGNNLYRTPRHFRRNSVTKKFFCNKSCFAVWKNKTLFVGSRHPFWKSGQASYRNTMLRRATSPICDDCGFEDVRALLVHHIDRNRQNNKVHNLKWLCHNCHYLEHEGKTI